MKTVVDTVEAMWRDDGQPTMLTIHFNNLDAENAIMPGAGGYVTRQVTEQAPAWTTAADDLVDLIERIGTRWVLDYDDFTDDKTPFAFRKSEFAQYRREDQDCGGHFRFKRSEDIFDSSILFEWRVGAMLHNQKRPVTETKMRAAILADIAAVLAAGQVLAATINASRVLSKKTKTGKGE